MARKPGQNKARKTQKSQTKKGAQGDRFTLSARVQTVLKTIFQDILQETLNDAKKIADQAGKGRVSLKDVETALEKLCSRFNPSLLKIQKKKS